MLLNIYLKIPTRHISQCISEMVLSWLPIFQLRVTTHLTKPPAPGIRSLLFSCWPWLSKKLPRHHKPLLLPLVAFQRRKVHPHCWKHLSLQIQGPELQITWKPSSWGQVFTVPEDVMQIFSRGKKPTPLYSYDTYKQQQWPARHKYPNVGRDFLFCSSSQITAATSQITDSETQYKL